MRDRLVLGFLLRDGVFVVGGVWCLVLRQVSGVLISTLIINVVGHCVHASGVDRHRHGARLSDHIAHCIHVSGSSGTGVVLH